MQRIQVLQHNWTSITQSQQVFHGVANDSAAPNLNLSGAELILHNEYYSYLSERGKNTVNDNNVREYLDDEKNLDLSLKFITFLKDSTSLEEFKEIFYNNKKLSAVFNEYYRNNILPDNNISTTAIPGALSRMSSTQTSSANFLDNNTRNLVHSTALDQNSPDDSYYVPLYIEQTRKLIDRADYSEYFKDCISSTYNYKRYTWINNVQGQIVYGNSTYINNRRGTAFGTIGILDFTPFNNLSPTYQVHLVTGGRGNGSQGNSFDYSFFSFSEFKNYFNYSTPEFTSPSPGTYITQDALYVTNSFLVTSTQQGYYYSYSGPSFLFNIRFVANSAIHWDKSSGDISIPITIELNQPAQHNETFIIKAEPYSNATLFNDFIIDQNNPTSNIHIATIAQGQRDYSFQMTLKQDYTEEESAVLSLHNATGETVGFLIIKLEETLEVETYNDQSFLLIEDELRQKLMLRCFVDYNFNDNESYPWHNNNINIVDNSAPPPGTATSTPSAQRIGNNSGGGNNNAVINLLAETTRTSTNNIINVYRFGSFVYGTQNANSDIDYIMVLNNYRIPYENFRLGNINIQIYTLAEYQKKINNNEFPLIETTFYPDEFIIQENYQITPALNASRISDSAIEQAYVDYNRAKRNTISGEKSGYFVRKNLFHAFRKLVFAIELITKNTIEDFTIAMPYYDLVFSREFNTPEEIDSIFKTTFDTLIEQTRLLGRRNNGKK